MKKSKKIFLIIFLFALSNFTIFSLQANSYSLSGNSITFNNNNISFSIDPHYTQSTTDIFSIYNDFNNFYLTLSTASMYSYYFNTQSKGSIPVSSIVKNYTQILDQNFFISNNVEFIAASTNYNGNYSLTIKDLQTNQTLAEHGITPYSIASISSFNNSSDVYFSFSNETMFNIVKYSFQYNNFSIFIHSKNLVFNDYFLSKVDVFNLDNKIFSSFVTTDNTTSALIYNTTIIVSNRDNILFNKTFQNDTFDHFTPTSKGFILHSSQNSEFYDYHFSTNSYFNMSLTFDNINALKPFNNNSFMVVTTNSLDLFGIDSNPTINLLNLTNSYSLTNNINKSELFSYNLASGRFYILGMQDQNNQYTISLINYGQGPDNSQTSVNTSPFPSSSTLTNPDQTNFNQGTSTISSVSVLADPVFIIFFFILFGCFAIGIIVYSNRQKKIDQFNNRRDLSFPGTNNYQNNIQANSQQYYRRSSFCVECGSLIEPDDVFCQNCGRRI